MNNNLLRNAPLKDQALEILRDLIMRGQITPEQKLTEQGVMDMLNIGRMPARDALMKLEEQGLVVTKPDARYVVKLGAQDIRQLFDIRKALELLAIEGAAQHCTEADCARLHGILREMDIAVSEGDVTTYIQTDLNIHQTIWDISRNPHLIKMLRSMTGPIYMFISSHTTIQHNWDEVMDLHSTLVQAVCDHDHDSAIEAINVHMSNSLEWSLKIFDKE
ncbi:GntR family transcriptional regulator [Phototrophicus methaneseepsis]|uniref:GntR family transcriptional regulator n=1 Tax=Phototrophicus methaneseepsis TaxID=2710758 RepID=A0A7S8EBY6_9CHLR|nr:GntR family transcriptional regulator [Phototrophicus methaneseepsis]QPC84172.1 GntR family transcriptional regulator [Phototrophicus methaneseepsis]